MPVNRASSVTGSGGAALATRETAMLMASLMRGSAKAARSLQPETLMKLLSDPVRLSSIVRQAGLELEMQQAEGPPHLALQSALARVSPQHVEKLVAVLAQQEQPAINPDPTYGEPAALGEIGSSRGQQSATASTHHPYSAYHGNRPHDLDITALNGSIAEGEQDTTAEDYTDDDTAFGVLPNMSASWQADMQLAYHPLLIAAIAGAAVILALAWW